MNKIYEIQCAVRGCTTKRGRKESALIHRFPKREDIGQRWIEACAKSYLSRLEYPQVVGRKFFVFHRHFDEQYFYQKRNGAFLLKRRFFFNFEINSRLSTSVFIFSTISKI